MRKSTGLINITRRLRILMVAPQPFFRARGTPFSVLHRIRALVEAGHNVDLVTYPFGENIEMPGLRIIRAGRPPFIDDVKIGPSIAKLILDFPLYVETVRALKRNEYDVLHSHEEAAFFSVNLADRFKLLHIYDMHSSLPHQLSNFSSYNLGPIRWLFSWLERRVLESCDGVITICKELEDIALPICGNTPQRMIENTADDRKIFSPSTHDTKVQYQLDERKIILYTGTLEPYQGIDLLLGAVQILQGQSIDAQLVLVGGRPKQIEHYDELATELGIGAAVTFVGTVHPSEIPGFINAANVIVSPRSTGTNTPLKVYGYMRSSIPVVATNLPTHTQTLDEEIACLVPATSAGIADGIQRVLGSPEYGQSLAAAARRRANARYSDSGYVKKVNELYNEVLARPAKSIAGGSYGEDQTPLVETPKSRSESRNTVQ